MMGKHDQASGPTGAFDRVRDFLSSIGLPVTIGPLKDCFLSGVEIREGILHVAREDDRIAGNLLHEAGHIAVTPARFRHLMTGDAENQTIMAAYETAMTETINPDDPLSRAILQSGEMEVRIPTIAAMDSD